MGNILSVKSIICFLDTAYALTKFMCRSKCTKYCLIDCSNDVILFLLDLVFLNIPTSLRRHAFKVTLDEYQMRYISALIDKPVSRSKL